MLGKLFSILSYDYVYFKCFFIDFKILSNLKRKLSLIPFQREFASTGVASKLRMSSTLVTPALRWVPRSRPWDEDSEAHVFLSRCSQGKQRRAQGSWKRKQGRQAQVWSQAEARRGQQGPTSQGAQDHRLSQPGAGVQSTQTWGSPHGKGKKASEGV